MHHPDDTSTAYAYHDYARGWLHSRQSDAEARPPRVLDLLEKDFERRRGRAKVTALVLLSFIEIFDAGWKPSLRMAYAQASEVMAFEPLEGKRKAVLHPMREQFERLMLNSVRLHIYGWPI